MSLILEPAPIFTLCPPRASMLMFPLKPIEIDPVGERLIEGKFTPAIVCP